MISNIWVQSHLHCDEQICEHIKQTLQKYYIQFPEEEQKQLKWFNVNNKTEGININHLSKFFNEYCTMYYVWKNDIQSDIVSFSHYSRIIFPRHIKNDFLISNNYFQFYNAINLEQWQFILYKNEKFDSKYFLIKALLKMTNFPQFVIDTVCEYFDKQTCINQFQLERYTNYKPGPYTFIRRSIFSCNWETFDNYMKFIDGFFTYFFNKYNLDYDKKVLYNFFVSNVLKHYKMTNYDEIEEIIQQGLEKENDMNYNEHFEQLYIMSRGYCGDIEFHQIFNPSTQFGFNTYCNIWRMFGYLTEILTGIYIYCNLNFYNPEQYIQIPFNTQNSEIIPELPFDFRLFIY